jgi:flagellar basal body-associated protein FliL
MNSANQSAVIHIDWVAIVAIAVTIVIAMIVGVFTISRIVTKAFHAVDKRVHGVEVIVGPYSKKFEDVNVTLSDHSDRLAKVEAAHSARTSVIERHERLLDAILQKR